MYFAPCLKTDCSSEFHPCAIYGLCLKFVLAAALWQKRLSSVRSPFPFFLSQSSYFGEKWPSVILQSRTYLNDPIHATHRQRMASCSHRIAYELYQPATGHIIHVLILFFILSGISDCE